VLVREAIRGLALGGVQRLRPEDLIRDALVIIGVSSPADWRDGAGIGEARLRYVGSQPTIRVSLRPGKISSSDGRGTCALREGLPRCLEEEARGGSGGTSRVYPYRER
jgi:hypothetical protein